MAAYTDWTLIAAGADTDAKVAASDNNAYVAVPKMAAIRNLLNTAEFTEGVATADHVLWPWWAVSALVSAAYADRGVTLYASDMMPLPQTAGRTLEDAESTGAFTDVVGIPTLAVGARLIGRHAKAQRAAGNATPYELRDADVYNWGGATLPAGHAAELLNDLMSSELFRDEATAGDVPDGQPEAALLLPLLLHPMTPSPDLDGDAGVVMQHITATARTAFPALAGTSIRLAVARLLAVPAPVEILVLSASLASRVALVDLLGAWADVAARPALLQQYFPRMLTVLEHLGQWVRTATGPFQKGLQLMKLLSTDTKVLDIDAFVILDGILGQCADRWAAGKSADANIAALHDALRGSAQSPAAGAAAGGSGAAVSTDRLAAEGADAARMAKLADDLVQHFASDEADPLEAIEIIVESRVSKALRWLQGEVAAGSLPPVFAASCAALPGKIDEYVIDALKHDDKGNLDPDLEELTVSSLYTEASTLAGKRVFFARLWANKFAAIQWEPDLIHKLSAILDPDSKATYTQRAAYGDSDRWSLHETYVGRALAAVGKPADVDNSFAAVSDEWRNTLAQARRGGGPLKEDTLDQIVTLMDGVWTNAEAHGAASLRGALYANSLFDAAGFSELAAFRSFAEAMPGMKKMTRHFKRSFAAMVGGSSSSASPVTPKAPPNGSTPPPPAKPYVAPLPGSKIATIGVDGDWQSHTATNDEWFHVANCQRVIKEKLGVDGACVLACTCQVTKGHELESALAFCAEGHALTAPQHQLVLQRALLFSTLKSAGDCVERRSGLAQAAGKAPRRQGKGGGRGTDGKGGDRGAAGGGRGRGRFRRQAARV